MDDVECDDIWGSYMIPKISASFGWPWRWMISPLPFG